MQHLEVKHVIKYLSLCADNKHGNMQVRIHIGNQLYDVNHIDTVIDMDTNKPNIVIHVKEK